MKNNLPAASPPPLPYGFGQSAETATISRPVHSAPGTLAEQLATIFIFLEDPRRQQNRDLAWQRARRTAMPHLNPPTSG